MDLHIKHTQMDLAEASQRAINTLAGYQPPDHLLGDFRAGDVVTAELGQERRIPTPCLQHQGGGFAEILHRLGAVEGGEAGGGDEVVDAVAELVEELDEVFVFEEGGGGGGGEGEVVKEGGGGVVSGVVWVRETLGGRGNWHENEERKGGGGQREDVRVGH